MKKKVFLSGGSGKMGTQIQELLTSDKDFSLGQILDRNSASQELHQQASVWMDFSHDDFLFQLLKKMQNEKKYPALLTGTTNLSDKTFEELHKFAKLAPVLWTPNTSLGVGVTENLFSLLAQLKDYEWSLEETHHAQKKDAPSGTAKRWLQKIQKILPGKNIPITSLREGTVVGKHILKIKGPFEEITIQHEAKDRKLFAQGALNLANQLIHFPNGYYEMESFLRQER